MLANNPGPPDFQAYRCVAKNTRSLFDCAYDRALHDADPGFRTQQKAAAGQPEVKMIDMFDVICPYERCPAVIGNVLVYRTGTHLTATYVKTMVPFLARELSDVGLTAR